MDKEESNKINNKESEINGATNMKDWNHDEENGELVVLVEDRLMEHVKVDTNEEFSFIGSQFIKQRPWLSNRMKKENFKILGHDGKYTSAIGRLMLKVELKTGFVSKIISHDIPVIETELIHGEPFFMVGWDMIKRTLAKEPSFGQIIFDPKNLMRNIPPNTDCIILVNKTIETDEIQIQDSGLILRPYLEDVTSMTLIARSKRRTILFVERDF